MVNDMQRIYQIICFLADLSIDDIKKKSGEVSHVINSMNVHPYLPFKHIHC